MAVDISPLRTSVPYRALWGGQVVSLIGTSMRVVAVPFQVFAMTGSSASVGLLGLAEVVPLIAVSVLAGAFIDVFDRRKILALASLLMLANSAVLAALTFSDAVSLSVIYLLVAIDGAVVAVEQPTRSAMVPGLVQEDQIPAAMALRQVAFQTTHIAGPAVGGLLIAALGGVAWLYVIDALTFLAALAALRWVPSTEPRSSSDDAMSPRVTPDAIREGLLFTLRSPVILSIFLIDLVAMIFGMPRAVFPALAEETFAVGASGLGLLYSAPAAGALLAALTTGWVERVRRQGVWVIVAVTIWGAAITIAGLSGFSFPVTLWWLGVAGAADVISAVFRGTMLIESTPDRLLGRVSSLNLMVVAGGPRLGDVEAGWVAHLVGAGPSVTIGGVACLMGTGIIAATSPSLRGYRSGTRRGQRKDGAVKS